MEDNLTLRIVATSDTHFPFPKEFVPDGDVLIHAGDALYKGTPDEWDAVVQSFADLPHKTKIFVPGNHDRHVELYPGPALQDLRKAGVTVLGLPNNDGYRFMKLENGKSVLGLPWVTNLPRWSFNRDEEWIEKYLESVGRHHIVVSHSPAKAILDGSHYGINVYRKYLKRFQPELWFCGHVHEAYGQEEKDGCRFFNVCAQDREYSKLANPPVVIDF